MKFKIKGVDRNTGKMRKIEVEADDERGARDEGDREGVLPKMVRPKGVPRAAKMGIGATVAMVALLGVVLAAQAVSELRERQAVLGFAEDEIKAHLVSPDSATFHPRRGHDEIAVLQNDDGTWYVAGEVSSTNAFNARLRDTFLVTIRREEDRFTVTTMAIGTDVVKSR